MSDASTRKAGGFFYSCTYRLEPVPLLSVSVSFFNGDLLCDRFSRSRAYRNDLKTCSYSCLENDRSKKKQGVIATTLTEHSASRTSNVDLTNLVRVGSSSTFLRARPNSVSVISQTKSYVHRPGRSRGFVLTI